MALVVDAGPLYAYIDAEDKDHTSCLELLESYPGPLLVPQLVVTEVAYLLETRLGENVEIRFLLDLVEGNLIPEPVAAPDWIRIAELVAQYADMSLGTVDASVIALAERLGCETVATLDSRHFDVVKPKHVQAFNLVPNPF